MFILIEICRGHEINLATFEEMDQAIRVAKILFKFAVDQGGSSYRLDYEVEDTYSIVHYSTLNLTDAGKYKPEF